MVFSLCFTFQDADVLEAVCLALSHVPQTFIGEDVCSRLVELLAHSRLVGYLP